MRIKEKLQKLNQSHFKSANRYELLIYDNMETRLVEATIRAPRIATFVKAKDLHWQDTVLRIIETYSKIWGGAYDIIVPYEIRDDVLSIDQVFKAILKKYDPDFLCVYPKHQLDTERQAV